MRHTSALSKLALGVLVVAILATGSFSGSTAYGIEERVLKYGNIEMLINDSLRYHGEYRRFTSTLIWPVGWWARGNLTFVMPYYTFESLTMTATDGTTSVVANAWGYPWASGVGGGMFIRGGEKGLMEWRKYYPPYFETDGIPKRPYPDEDDVDLTMGPDQRGELLGRTGNAGIRFHRFMDVWVNQNHDDYFIETNYHRPDWIRDPDAEVVVKHPAQVAIVSFGNGYYYQPTDVGVREWNRLAYDIWYNSDEWYTWMVRPVEDYGLDVVTAGNDAFGGKIRDSLVVSYMWDDDNTQNTEEPYDLGDPSPVDGEFLAYQIPGNAIFFASRAPLAGRTEVRPEDWAAEPDWYNWTAKDHTIYTQIDDNRDPSGTIATSWAEYYFASYFADSGLTSDQVNIGWQSQPVAIWAAGQMSEMWGRWRRNPADTWQFMTLPKRLISTFEDGTDLNAMTISGKYGYQFVGPYCINKTDEIVRYVHAVGVGGVGPDSARAMGARWHAGNMTPEEKRELVIGGGGNVNPLLGTNYEVWYRGGRDSLFHTLERAYWNFLGEGGSPYNVPDPPPSPDLVVTSGPDRIDLKWWYPDASYYKDPDTAADDFAEWRIYRKKGERDIGTMDERGTTDPDMLAYRLVHTEPSKGEGDTLRWADSAVQRGQPYYYYVTAVDDGSQNTTGLVPGQAMESSMMANRIEFGAVPFKPAKPSTDEIRVVPNPYNVNSGGGNYTGSAFDANKVLFVNLPALCMIYIYTESGELVKTINHDTRNADHAWEQLTESGQYAKSGIYLAKITDATNELKTESYADAIVKFIIIR